MPFRRSPRLQSRQPGNGRARRTNRPRSAVCLPASACAPRYQLPRCDRHRRRGAVPAHRRGTRCQAASADQTMQRKPRSRRPHCRRISGDRSRRSCALDGADRRFVLPSRPHTRASGLTGRNFPLTVAGAAAGLGAPMCVRTAFPIHPHRGTIDRLVIDFGMWPCQSGRRVPWAA
jgi:hypothetical protein